MFSNKTDEILKERINELKEERDYLRKRVESLESALLSIRAPDAYKDMKADEAEAKYPTDPEAMKKLDKMNKAREIMMAEIEKPLWESPEQMEEMLLSSTTFDHPPLNPDEKDYS